MVQIKQKRGAGVESPSPREERKKRSFSGGELVSCVYPFCSYIHRQPGVEAIGGCVHKQRALNTRLSSGTSAGTFTVSTALAEITKPKQVRKMNLTRFWYQLKKSVGKSILTFRT